MPFSYTLFGKPSFLSGENNVLLKEAEKTGETCHGTASYITDSTQNDRLSNQSWLRGCTALVSL
jgi:hypothetical protein